MRSWRSRTATAVVAAVALAWPASASALSVSVTGDDGRQQALTGQTMRNMAPQLGLAVAAADAFVTVSVTGPGGQPAASGFSCAPASAVSNRTVTYQGNGSYTVSLASFSNPTCTAPVSQGSFSFSIGAGVALGTDPNSPLLTREPGERATLEHRLPLTGSPGAGTYDVFSSTNRALAGDGSLVGPSRRAFVDPATGTVPLRFSRPGSYTVVARARVLGGAASPWSRPVTLRLFAPFDVVSSSFPDARGPSYRLRVRVRERTARGRVYISYARGWSGRAHYHSLGRTSIGRHATFTKRFRLRRTGSYRIRYRFAGSRTTAPGTVVEKVRIRSVVRVRSSAASARVHEPR